MDTSDTDLVCIKSHFPLSFLTKRYGAGSVQDYNTNMGWFSPASPMKTKNWTHKIIEIPVWSIKIYQFSHIFPCFPIFHPWLSHPQISPVPRPSSCNGSPPVGRRCSAAASPARKRRASEIQDLWQRKSSRYREIARNIIIYILYVYIYIYIYHTYIHIHIHIYIYHTYIHIHTYIYIYITHIYIYIYIYIYITYIYIYYKYDNIYICVCWWLLMYVCIIVCIYIYNMYVDVYKQGL